MSDKKLSDNERLKSESHLLEDIILILDSLLTKWAKYREKNEAFGDYAIRSKIVQPVLNSTVDFYL